MNVVGIGVDVCDVNRIERALARHPSMAGRVFTEEEIAYCESRARPAEAYAGRFAAREAAIKALGGYFRRRYKDISVTRSMSGEPRLLLSGNAKLRSDERAIEQLLVSFTHERTLAVAICVAVSR